MAEKLTLNFEGTVNDALGIVPTYIPSSGSSVSLDTGDSYAGSSSLKLTTVTYEPEDVYNYSAITYELDPFSGTDFTLTCYVKLSSTTPYASFSITLAGTDLDAGPYLQIYVPVDGNVIAGAMDSSPSITMMYQDSVTIVDEWCKYSLVCSAGVLSFYQNDVLLDSTNSSSDYSGIVLAALEFSSSEDDNSCHVDSVSLVAEDAPETCDGASFPMLTMDGYIDTVPGARFPLFGVSGTMIGSRTMSSSMSIPMFDVSGAAYTSREIAASMSFPMLTADLFLDSRFVGASIDATLPAILGHESVLNWNGSWSISAAVGGAVLNESLAPVRISSTSRAPHIAGLSQVLAPIRIIATASKNNTGTLTAILPAVRISSVSGFVSPSASLARQLPAVRLTSSAISGTIATLAKDLAALTLSSSAHWASGASAILVLPAIELDSRVKSITAEIITLCLNTKNKSLTEYTNYNYNSMCMFNGKPVGAKADGIYELAGDTDNGQNISWAFKTGKLDIDDKLAKKVRYAWLSYRPSGDLTLIVDDGENEYEYDVESYKDIDTGVRVKLGKGIRNKYLQLELQNKANETIFLDKLRLFAESTGRKR
jgi:hypothetical protein